MTPTTKKVVRESYDRDAGRNIVVIVGPGDIIGFRLKGTRKVYTMGVKDAYQHAVAIEVAYVKWQKKMKKKNKLY